MPRCEESKPHGEACMQVTQPEPTRVPRWEKELSLIVRFPDLQSPRGLAPWLVLYKPSWRVQQLKDGLEWNVFPLR
ncbi:hypothetical protein CapIbe_006670 [Capra ibex]